MKASARAYAIQGLIKYHGLKNPKLRIPFHDSISVCMKSLPTVTTVEFDPRLKKDIIQIGAKRTSSGEAGRVIVVLDALRHISGHIGIRARVESRNPKFDGKGLGYSASGFAALGLAASKALGLSMSRKELSQVVRLGAGSATRSLVGGFSIWYARKHKMSYAEQLATPGSINMKTLIVPVPSSMKTDKAHEEAKRSPFYKARLAYVRSRLERMKRAIANRDVTRICELAEEDTLNLHAITMTGPRGIVLFSPMSIRIMDEIRRLREEEDIPAWFSLDTGPSVFVNTTNKAIGKVRTRIKGMTDDLVLSEPGGPAEPVQRHLF